MPSSSPSRRQWLQAVGLTGFGGFGGLAGLSGLAPLAAWAPPAAAQPGPAGPQRLAAAWMQGHDLFAGIVQLTLDGAPLQVLQSERIPTRAHGMTVEADGAVVFTSRRPGDWLLRLRAGTAPQWGWIEPDRAFTGHVIHSRDGRQLYTTETDLETGQGLIGVRDAASLEKTAEWPTHGMDPHQLLLDADGSLVVANGGIPSQIETGRRKLQLTQMDSSIVRLQPAAQGALDGQWRLTDTRLSLRHLCWGPQVAWQPARRWLGIALQAEHDDPSTRAQAPVLALFDGQQLQVQPLPAGTALAGYGGDIGCDGQHFAVSCPRADQLTWWQPPARAGEPVQWHGSRPLQGVYPVANHSVSPLLPAPSPAGLWTAGEAAATRLADAASPQPAPALGPTHGRVMDNHWIPLPATA
jgi:hypothetical protein